MIIEDDLRTCRSAPVFESEEQKVLFSLFRYQRDHQLACAGRFNWEVTS